MKYKKTEIIKQKQEIETELTYINSDRDILETEIQQKCNEIDEKEQEVEKLELISEQLDKPELK